MMAMPRKRKPPVDPAKILASLVGAVAGLSICAWISVVQLRAATTERIVTDYHTGLAISGFDPVAYFTNGKAMLGSGEFETNHAGATWRFINEGNRGAFVASPDVYMPVFGGYDPTGVARGVAVAGNPEVWLIVGERLYLFRSPETRNAFEARSAEVITSAQSQWPEVVRKLAP